MTTSDWMQLFGHFLALSLVSVGGAMSTAPAMYRYLVDDHHWLGAAEFTRGVAIAQAAPGPNILFVAVLGWSTGMNAGGYAQAVLGLVLTTVGIMLPSSLLTYVSASWVHRHRSMRAVRAFKQAMAPLVVALLFSIGLMLAKGDGWPAPAWGSWAVTAVAALLIWRTRLHLLWLLGAGAVAGALGVV